MSRKKQKEDFFESDTAIKIMDFFGSLPRDTDWYNVVENIESLIMRGQLFPRHKEWKPIGEGDKLFIQTGKTRQ